MTGSKEPDAREIYADIMDHPRHVSDRHPRMSLYDRAAQFAPFAALSGYDDMVREEARQVDNRIELNEEDLALLNRKLAFVADLTAGGSKPVLSVTYFVPDPLKAGGRYETVTEAVRRVDPVEQLLVLDRKTGKAGSWMTVPVPDIMEIFGESLDQLQPGNG